MSTKTRILNRTTYLLIIGIVIVAVAVVVYSFVRLPPAISASPASYTATVDSQGQLSPVNQTITVTNRGYGAVTAQVSVAVISATGPNVSPADLRLALAGVTTGNGSTSGTLLVPVSGASFVVRILGSTVPLVATNAFTISVSVTS